MKKINYLIKYAVFCGVLILSSCDSTELDLEVNPNLLAPDQASPNFFLNAIQVDFAKEIVEPFGRTGAEVTRIDYMNGRNYLNAYSANSFDREWRYAYQRMMSDVHVMNSLAVESELWYHVGMGQVIEAYTLLTLVDFYGNVPYSEAFLGSENLNPKVDDGAAVYAQAISLLDEAIVNFGKTAAAEPQNDFYYGGDWTKWIKAANTIKMKAYMATRLVDASAITKFNAIVTSGDYIATTADDFQFTWGTNEIQPDTRHPRYSGSYTATGGGDYMSNSLMDYMTGPDVAAYGYLSLPYVAPTRDHFDIRTLFYFYRQVGATPGIAGVAPDEESLECGLYTAPTHYAGYTYCGVGRGWWGRDHGNNNGIPPDGFLRTLAGVYPAGGELDNASYDAKVNGDGNGGNGITPVMLASWTEFMKAEVELSAGNTGAAKAAVMAGINISTNKVVNFAETTSNARFNYFFGEGDDIGYGAYYAANGYSGLNGEPAHNYPATGPLYQTPDTVLIELTTALSLDWDAATIDGKWDILAMQYFVASYGNGIDAYNFYRRTGYPTTLQPNIEPNPGGFIRSFYYPANFANNNSSVTQKSGVDVQVFWDTNAASPGFPSAN